MTAARGAQWRGRHGQELDADLIVSEYLAGWGVPALSHRHQAGLHIIRSLIKSAGVQLRRPGPGPGGPAKSVPVAAVPGGYAPVAQPTIEELPDDRVRIDPAEAMFMLWSGRSLDEVAEHFDAETDSFRQAMSKASPEFRGYQRAMETQENLQRYKKHERRQAEHKREEAARRLREREERKRRNERVAAERRRQLEADARKRREEREAAERRAQEERDLRAHEEGLERRQHREAEERRQEELRDQVYELYEQGWTAAEIAEAVGVSREITGRLLSEWGVDKPRWFRVSDTAIEDCWHDLVFVDYARELQAAAQQVRGWTPQDSPLRRATEELAELLAMSLQAGVAGKFMAEQLGVTHGAVRMRVSRHGYAEMMPSQKKNQVPYGTPYVRARQDKCRHGHYLDGTLSNGRRWCRACDKRRKAESLERKRRRG